MPWIDGEFHAKANANGEVRHETRLSAPISGTVVKYKVKTTSGCEGRVHATVLTIARISDPGDRIEIHNSVPDCTEIEDEVKPNYRVRGGEQYDLALTATGFSNGEQVQGTAGVFYTLFFSLEDDESRGPQA
jgi:hypothetical protein